MITRRTLLKTSAAAGLTLTASGLAAPSIAQGAKIRLGYVSPQTGPLAGFAESDAYNIEAFLASEAGKNFEVIVKDSQSNPNRAAEVAKSLIIDDEINLMLVGSTPENTNPVATTCEAEGIPVISTMAPWQPWFIGQQGNPGDPSSWKPFEFAYHYFWGLEDIIAIYTGMWKQLDTNGKVGGLFPNDADGNAWGDPNNGLKPGLDAAGFSLTDPGRYQNLTDDFTAQVNAFKAANAEIVTGVVIPPDFTTFWNQARQQGFKPKAVTVAKAILFPQSVETLGDAGHNLSSEVWWSASHPFKSSVTGQSSADLAADFTAKTGRPWTQPIGFVHSLFEVAANVMGRVSDPTDSEAIAGEIAATDMVTVVGKVSWKGEGLPPFAAKNVCKTPLVGGQWRKKDDGFDLVIVENANAPEIPTAGKMEALS
ncbi:MAG: ABC transporter substrate-binding protein [Alphaproteobacteria bacterium]|jgi:branched-chain amino acid transport system substrate-binding protein|nr:ABC transporter substrate-binding protein [Alphaproteobacteria bacterium]MBU0804238.1 ABC transporter substrate-binding protein [Alphaproteobacteria bacterium]MBU0871069.1 ABC transporter substrate-binding protein [Alphaproteobacteria bacterium]MBU1400824.1 ABC transporter substrate-binding protein [Alphaproteobacteria bacterium]MBU1592759.1 ABC transporter substrate-binding protein [Alphaproteobacteria bacterium]